MATIEARLKAIEDFLGNMGFAPAPSPVTATDAGDVQVPVCPMDDSHVLVAKMDLAPKERLCEACNMVYKGELWPDASSKPAQPASGEVATPAAAKAPGHEQARALIERLSHPSTRETLEKCLGDLTAYVDQQEARDKAPLPVGGLPDPLWAVRWATGFLQGHDGSVPAKAFDALVAKLHKVDREARASALPPGVAELIAEWRALGSDQQGALMNLQEFPGQSPRTNEINSIAARLLRALVRP